ncbi:hypothetical protein ACFZ8E_12060 [Methylobacterium sp. HMF5984]|uniref:hypothetical protein n=1 Tax=unclassified Methylobacterium TaxID=2615210 RepID=UPI0016505506|nr:hypothetical protein [Methylobacterium sp. WL6]
MLASSLICLVVGTGLVAASLLMPAYRLRLEVIGAGLFIVGLCLLGAELPLLR